MKKGLLSLLAVALTVVGCQNYDDQFQSLTDQIAELSSALDTDVAAVRSDISALQTLIGTLATSNELTATQNALNGAISSVASDVSDLSDDVSDLSDDVSDLSDDVADVDAVADSNNDLLGQISSTLAGMDSQLDDIELDTAQLEQISSTLADIEADIQELLAANAIINQNIVITNNAQLEYVEGLITTNDEDPDSPDVIVNGIVKIDVTAFTPAITADQRTRVNAITTKIKTILGDEGERLGLEAVSTQPLNFDSLVYIDDDYYINGADMIDDNLVTITGSLTIDHGTNGGEVNYSHIDSVDEIWLANSTAATATAINFADVTASGALSLYTTLGTALAGLTFPNADTVNIGELGYTALTANRASSIVAAMDATTAATTIGAANATTVNLAGLETIGHTLTITGSSVTNILMDDVDAQSDVVSTVNTVASVQMGSLTGTGAALNLNATAIHLETLAALNNASDLGEVSDLQVPLLRNVTATLQIDNGPIDLRNVQFSGAGALTTAATTVHVGGGDDATMTDISPASVTHLTVYSQDTTITDLSATVVNASITASGTGSTIDINADATAAALAELHTTNFDVVNVANSTVVTMSTAGTTRNLVVDTNAALVSLSIGHTWDSSYTDAQLVDITDNLALTGADLSSVVRLEDCEITGNTAMTTITAPGTNDLLVAGATTSYIIKGNSLTATYTDAVAAITTGITSTTYVEASIVQPSLATWRTYLNAVNVVNSLTFDLDFDTESGAASTHNAKVIVDCDRSAGRDGDIGVNLAGSTCAGATTVAADDNDRETNGGTISTIQELNIVVAQ